MDKPTEPCKCEAMKHVGKSRHMNKEIPHFHRTDENGNTYIVTSTGRLSPIETNAVERVIEEHRQLEMFDLEYGLQDGDLKEHTPDEDSSV